MQKQRFVMVFVVSLFIWLSMSDRVFLSPRLRCQEVLESTESTLSRLPGPCNTDLYVSSKKWNHPFSLSTVVFLCVCLCVCARMTKAMRRQEDSALPWTLSLCYKSLLYAVCMLSPFELSLSHLLLAVFPFYLLLWFAHCKTSSSINTFHGSRNTAQKHFGGKKNAPKVHLGIFNYSVRQQVFIQGLFVWSRYNM